MSDRVTAVHTRAQSAAHSATQPALLRRGGLLQLREGHVDLLQVVRPVRAVREPHGGAVLRWHHRRHQEGASTGSELAQQHIRSQGILHGRQGPRRFRPRWQGAFFHRSRDQKEQLG